MNPTPAPPASPAQLQKKAHGITAGIIGGCAAFIWLVWSYPMILLYGVLAVVAVMAYAAVYLMVTARLEDEEDPPLPPLPEGPHANARLEDSRSPPPAADDPLPAAAAPEDE